MATEHNGTEMSTEMTGAEAVIRTAAAAGIDICFANPGTTELYLVEALDRCPEIRPVLSVFEGVCTGAADGYTRITGRPALALLHLGPGLANGLANLHNAPQGQLTSRVDCGRTCDVAYRSRRSTHIRYQYPGPTDGQFCQNDSQSRGRRS